MAASILLICYRQFRVEPRFSDVLCEDVVEKEEREAEAAKSQVHTPRKSEFSSKEKPGFSSQKSKFSSTKHP